MNLELDRQDEQLLTRITDVEKNMSQKKRVYFALNRIRIDLKFFNLIMCISLARA